MNPYVAPGQNMNTDKQISYLSRLLRVMLAEDLQRPLEPTVRLEDTQLVRRLPVISVAYLNPESIRLKTLQEATVAAMAQPKDNPWFSRLSDEYLGKILCDRKVYYRVFAIQYVPNTGKNVFPCWEATTEPVHKQEDGQWVVHQRHLVHMEDGTTKLLKSAEVRTLTRSLTRSLTPRNNARQHNARKPTIRYPTCIPDPNSHLAPNPNPRSASHWPSTTTATMLSQSGFPLRTHATPNFSK